jgi:hypothetical protein
MCCSLGPLWPQGHGFHGVHCNQQPYKVHAGLLQLLTFCMAVPAAAAAVSRLPRHLPSLPLCCPSWWGCCIPCLVASQASLCSHARC